MFQLIIQNCLNVFQHTFQITAIKSTQTDVFSEKMAYFANYGNSWWCRVQGVRGGGERESRMERMDGSTVWAVGNVPPSYDTHSDWDCIQCVADCNIGGESPEPGCEILIWYRCNVGGGGWGWVRYVGNRCCLPHSVSHQLGHSKHKYFSVSNSFSSN